MHIWTIENWMKVLNYDVKHYRKGLRFIFDDGVDPFLRCACKDFAVWLRKEYNFPVRIPVYFKNKQQLRCIDGDLAYGTFFEPCSYEDEPYIRIAVGDFQKLCAEWGEDDAVFSVFKTITHELTHYFQWINGLKLTPRGKERQATAYSQFVIDEYAEIWEQKKQTLPSTPLTK